MNLAGFFEGDFGAGAFLLTPAFFAVVPCSLSASELGVLTFFGAFGV